MRITHRHRIIERLPPALLATLLCASLTTSGCGLLRSAAVSASAETVGDLVAAIRSQPDPEIVRQGLPAILLLLDGLVAAAPDDADLLLAATNAYTSYCQAFLASSDENERAVRLYTRAREYGLRLLGQRSFFAEAMKSRIEDFDAALEEFTVDDVAHMHAAAAAWLGWIVADNQSMAALADLPRALSLTQRVLELDESHGDGSGHLVFALFYAAQPRGAGQDLEKSKKHFERAIELAGPENLLPRVVYAEQYGKATLNRDFFVKTLTAVLDEDPARYPGNRFLNELAQQRARALLAREDEIF